MKYIKLVALLLAAVLLATSASLTAYAVDLGVEERMARRVISSRFPIGVATRYKVPLFNCLFFSVILLLLCAA